MINKHVRVHCPHCHQSTDSLGNTRIHLRECRGLADVFIICGCCGTTLDSWRRLNSHVNQGGFHRREALSSYDGTVESVLAAPKLAAPAETADESEETNSDASIPELQLQHEIFLDVLASPDPLLSNLNCPPLLLSICA